jgi:hypothetical protein
VPYYPFRSFPLGAPPDAYPTRRRDVLLRYLPWWLQGPLTRAFATAVGKQLDDALALNIRDEIAAVGVARKTIELWETDFGLQGNASLSLARRRELVQQRMRGQAIRNDADFVAYATQLLRPYQSGAATPYVHPGLYVVYKAHDAGPLANLRAAEDALRGPFPASMGVAVAHWQTDTGGLTAKQRAEMQAIARAELTAAERDGA